MRNYTHTNDNLSRKEWILEHVNDGMTVVISTYTRAWEINKKVLDRWALSGHELFKDVPNNIIGTQTYMRSGKRWDCISGCSIRAY